MTDAQSYRIHAAECLSAAKRSGPAYRNLTVSIAASWLALARHEEAMKELLETGSIAQQSFRVTAQLLV
jgi:hypothetical protein